MNESPSISPTPAEPLDTSIPLDLKLFYGFVVVLVLSVVALIVLWHPDNSPLSPPDPGRHLGTFQFTDQTGRAVGSDELTNKFLIVNFVHTSCSISCYQVNLQMAEAQRLTAERGDVRLLSFTVDPRTDTPEVLAEFGGKFGADSNRWHLLTGDKRALYQLIETSFLKRDPQHSTSPMPGGFQDVDGIAVVDKSGEVRRYFDGMKTTTPAKIASYLDELRKKSN